MSDPTKMAEIDEVLKHLKVLRLEPGDVLIITYPCVLSAAAAARLRTHFDEMFPGHRAVVLDGGGNLGVVRVGEAP